MARINDTVLPVLFLDFDGVICTHRSYADSGYYTDPGGDRGYLALFDPACCKWVARLCAESRCDIVISSAWRKMHTPDELRSMLRHHGIKARVLGVTPARPSGHRMSEYLCRGQEVDLWLEQHRPGIQRNLVVCLEDVEEMAPWDDRTVWTSFDGDVQGFREEHYNRAMALWG